MDAARAAAEVNADEEAAAAAMAAGREEAEVIWKWALKWRNYSTRFMTVKGRENTMGEEDKSR